MKRLEWLTTKYENLLRNKLKKDDSYLNEIDIITHFSSFDPSINFMHMMMQRQQVEEEVKKLNDNKNYDDYYQTVFNLWKMKNNHE